MIRAARPALAAVLVLAASPLAFAFGPLPGTAKDIAKVTPMGIIELRDGTSSVDVLPYALVAEEKANLGAPQRLGFRPDLKRFTPVLPNMLGSFMNADALWLSFTVRSAASARSWLLAAGPNNIDSVDVYIVDSDGSVESMAGSSSSGQFDPQRASSEYTFRLTIGPGQVKTVYMRFAAEGMLSVRARIWDAFDFLKTGEYDSTFMGFAFGVILAIFLYTLFISLSLREDAYFYYLVYLAGLLLLVLVLSDPGLSYLRVRNPWLAKRAATFFGSLMAFGMLLFARRFLSIRNRSRWLSTALLTMAVFVPIYDIALAFLNLRAATRAGFFIDTASRVLILAAAIFALARERGRREWYFLVAWIVACAGAMLARAGTFGILAIEASLSAWSHIQEGGALAQILILSYGITDAINSMRGEKEAGQRRAIELLERANKVKEDFVIGTSLEFRSPLYGIVGLVDALDKLSAERASPEERRLSALIRAETLRLLGSVANVASYARLRNGDIAIVAERVSLREVSQDVARSASYIASGKDLAIEINVEDVQLVTDARLFEQIIYNLFVDALKRSPTGIAAIEGSASGDRVLVSVVDSAGPLPEEQLSRFLFAGNPGNRESVGPGLELLVARLLAERLGGSLSYSWTEGRGRFALDLPLELPRAAAGKSGTRGSSPSFLGWLSSKMNRSASVDLTETSPGKDSRGLVLAYDEDPVFLEALKRYLEGRGYAVAPTLSADKAVALACSRRFDLVLLDASGQGRPGLAACARIRGVHSMGDLPVVVMTDRESAEAVEAAFRAGASDYLPKLSPNELLFARVDTHVALRRAVEEALETRRRVAELEKLKTLGVLSAGVAHEVNTPNNAIIRNMPVISEIWRELAPSLRRLMDETEGFSIKGWTAEELMKELPELLADTYNAGLQIKKIVEDLKDYARDSSSSPPEPVDLSSIAAYSSRLLQPLVERSTKRFVLDAPAGLPLVRANFQKLTQVSVSILENALQSLPDEDAGVRLSTRYEASRGRVVLECADEGIGIDPELLEKVFEPFFTTKRESGGTGLGLSVAIGIVRDAGGEIAIDSRQGKGTTVRVVLPAIDETERHESERES
jgi:two-component system, sensor histidine kinase LadS